MTPVRAGDVAQVEPLCDEMLSGAGHSPPVVGWPVRPEAASCFPPQVLLTLDDDLDVVRRDKIPVF